MTVTTALSPAHAQAFHATQLGQSKRHGEQVQFSLPPVNDPAATPGAGTAPAPGGTGTTLPIAVPIAALNDFANATPLQPAGPAGTPGAAQSHGNLVSARLISRLYQQQEG